MPAKVTVSARTYREPPERFREHMDHPEIRGMLGVHGYKAKLVSERHGTYEIRPVRPGEVNPASLDEFYKVLERRLRVKDHP